MSFDLYKDSFGKDKNGKDIYLKDIWPSNKEIEETLKIFFKCRDVYKKIFKCFTRSKTMARN